MIVDKVESGQELRFMRQYFDQGLYMFKYESFKQLQPDVVSLGTSRVMQFRQEMFTRGVNFINLGGMVQHLMDLEQFEERLPSHTSLKFAILGVEFWWFIEDFAKQAEKNKSFATAAFTDDAYDGFAHMRLFQSFVRNSVGLGATHEQPSVADMGKVVFSREEFSVKPYGWYAYKKGSGFRSDGSFDYNEQPAKSIFVDRENIVSRIQDNQWLAAENSGLSERYIARLLGVLKKFRNRGIEIVVFLPPFSAEAQKTLNTSTMYHEVWRDYLLKLPEILQDNNFLVVDGNRIIPGDTFMRDGFHAMETFHLKLLKELAEGSVAMRQYVDTGYLDALLSDQKLDPWYPDYGQ